MFTIDSIEFQGPVANPDNLENKPGLFVLLELTAEGAQVIDFGFMKDLHSELSVTVRDTKLWKGTLAAGFKYAKSADEAEPLVERLEHWFDNSETSQISIEGDGVPA
ncbi:MAG TPA: hypothetical protein V6C89_00160 [Drouetiella sp.]